MKTCPFSLKNRKRSGYRSCEEGWNLSLKKLNSKRTDNSRTPIRGNQSNSSSMWLATQDSLNDSLSSGFYHFCLNSSNSQNSLSPYRSPFLNSFFFSFMFHPLTFQTTAFTFMRQSEWWNLYSPFWHSLVALAGPPSAGFSSSAFASLSSPWIQGYINYSFFSLETPQFLSPKLPSSHLLS